MLDPISLLLAIFVTHIASAIVLSGAWFSLKGESALANWALSRVFSSAAILCLLLREVINPAISILLGNSLFFVSFYLILKGFRRFAGLSDWPLSYVLGVYVFYAVCIAYAALPQPQHDLLVVISSALFVLFYAVLVYMLWPRNRGYESLIANLLVVVFAVNVGAFAYRLALGLQGQAGTALLDSSSQDTVVYLVTIATALMVTMGFLAMVAERINERLLYRADHDHLTGLYNRVRLDSEMEKRLQGRLEGAPAFGVIIGDLDFFKSVNDTLGHQAGDKVLMTAAGALRKACAPEDSVGRLGGEEFLIIAECETVDALTSLAESLRQAIEQCEIRVTGQQLTASFGVAAHEPGESLKSLLSRADKALYQAKEMGRNRVCASPWPGIA